MKIQHSEKGSSLIELIIVFALLSLLLPVVIIGLTSTGKSLPQQKQRISATAIYKEVQEAVKQIKDESWSSFAVNGIYHPVINSTKWALAIGSHTENGFTTQVIIADAYRNPEGQLVQSGGVIDPSTKKVTISVSWTTPLAQSITATNYYTRYRDNRLFSQTTVTDFNYGTPSGTTIVNTDNSSIPDDGEITLGAGGNSNWCSPSLSISSFDLNGQGITTALTATSTAQFDYIYTTTGGNSSGNSMDGVKVSHDDPPATSTTGIYNNRKTYGIYVDVPNQYVYLTSDHPSLTVDIVQVATLPYSQTGTFQASGGGTGTSVYSAFHPSLRYDVGYVSAGNYLYTFNLSSKSGARSQLGRVSTAGAGRKIVVIGIYAYVALSSSSEQFAIFDISNPSSPVKVSKIDVGNSQKATDVFVNSSGTRAYLITQQTNPARNNFFIIDTTNKITSLPPPLGSYNTGSMNPLGITAVPGNRVIIVGSGGEQYQVLRIDNESAPTRCGGLTNPHGATSLNAVSSLLQTDGSAYSYTLTNQSTNELMIIEGGPGGGSYTSSGTYESPSFDATTSAGFNRFVASVSQPDQASLSMQIGVANPVNNSCLHNQYTYIGPDIQNPTLSYFTPINNKIQGRIPVVNYGSYTNPARCFRYKLFMSTNDKNSTPVFSDFNLNYSP